MNGEASSKNGSAEIIRRFLPELVYGSNDGVVTTFAIVAGITGASLSHQTVLILGFASLFADGISMAASNVLSERSKTEERPSLLQASRHGAATFIGFVLAGIVPLTAYLIPAFGASRFVLAAILAGVTLFAVGASRAFLTDRSALRAGGEMFVIGALAGGVAFVVGRFGAQITGGAF